MRWIAVAAVVVAAAVLIVRAASGSAPEACAEPSRGVLPEWARTGFSDSEPRIEHVIGDDGRIAAIIFGPLSSPPLPDRGNKILWVSRDPVQPLSDLQIRAEHDGEVVTRVVRGGPGPSGIDLPAAGCWHMTLRWSGRSDTLALRYTKP
jgi:hypothetical protein